MRKRMVDPSYWSNPKAREVGIYAWTLFGAMWSIADDAGRLRDEPHFIKGTCLPQYDHATTTRTKRWLDSLETIGVIHRYSVGGSKYIQIAQWNKYQKVNRPSPSTIPPPNSLSDSLNHSLSDSLTTHGVTHAEGKGGEGKIPSIDSSALDLERPYTSKTEGPNRSQANRGQDQGTQHNTYSDDEKALLAEMRRGLKEP